MQSRYDQISPVPPLTKITKYIIIVCSVIYFVDFILFHLGVQFGGLYLNEILSDVSKLNSPIIGASGAVFGVLAAYGIFFGDRYFLVFFVFPMKAKYFVLVMAAIELITGVEASASDNVAHFAHIGGMLIG